ncbi:hypothetical protein HDU85_006183 [Gaertneriomyces sp. JEL0708]|nr:hypothetical protein HDU85_006183 [Gaertneriomyces sp. JEL0708]
MQVDVLSPSTAQPPSFHPRSQRRRQNNGGRRGGNGQRAQAQDNGAREPELDAAAHQQNPPRRVFTSTGTGVVSSAEALTSSSTSEANQPRRGDGGNGRHGGSRRRGGRAAGGDSAGRERNTPREPQNNGANRLSFRDGASASANDVYGDEQHARHAPRRRRPKIALTGDSSNPASEPASTVEERSDDRRHNKDKRNRRASPPPVSIDLEGLDDLTATLIEGLTTAEYEFDTLRHTLADKHADATEIVLTLVRCRAILDHADHVKAFLPHSLVFVEEAVSLYGAANWETLILQSLVVKYAGKN